MRESSQEPDSQPRGDSVGDSQPRGESLAEVLYESATTRVFRPLPAMGVVCKQPLGPDAGRRLRHEVAMLERLAGVPGVAQLASRHPFAGVVPMQERWGLPLDRLLEAGRCELTLVLDIAAQLTRTLAQLHARGVIHRDVNPANILLTRTGEAVLIDFDLAALQPHTTPASEARMVGTAAYLAPEQTGRTGRIVDRRADLYALGATLYELATGRLPFETQDPLELIHQHMVGEPPAPSQVDASVPQALSAIVMRLLSKAPEHRYQSAEGLHHDIARLRSELAQGGPGSFQLGELDFPSRLAPAGLVGRDRERDALHDAFRQAMDTTHQAVLVAGSAGVGKTALVHELKSVTVAAGGWFVSGKFDQYHREGATAGAVTQAARAFARLLLSLPPDEMAAQRSAIQDKLGRGAGLLTRLSPEFGLFLGQQPQVPEVDPRQAEQQLVHAIAGLLGAVASARHPVVVFMDDLQWAGSLSLRGFGHLLTEPGLRGLLLVGAYRPEEVGDGHPLAGFLEHWAALPQPPLRVALDNLEPPILGELVAGMLKMPPGGADSLARAVATLTAGNPFDTVEMVNALRDDGVLTLGEQGWQWDDGQVRRFVGGGNVADLLATRIAGLPAESRELLEFMSCLGSHADHELLAAATGQGTAELRKALAPLLDTGLLVVERGAAHDAIRFRHDRVQQAALLGMDDARRAGHQLAMARRLARSQAFAEQAAEQYLRCVTQLDAPMEQRDVAGLFLVVAGKLAGTATFQLADRYLAAAGTLLDAAGDRDMAIRAELDAARHAALYSLGMLQEADPFFASLQANAIDPLQMLEPTCLQMRSLFMRGQVGAARQLGLRLLERLGLHAPPDYHVPDARERLAGMVDWIRSDAALDHRRRPHISEPRLLAVAKLLGRLSRPAYFPPDSAAFQWVMLESQRLWAEHGPCPELVASLGRMSALLVTVMDDYRGAYEVARHALAVGEVLGWEPHASEARFIFGTLAVHWFEPLEDTLGQLSRAAEGVQATGDLSYAGYVHAVLITSLLETAPSIDVSAAEVEAGIEMCQRAGNVHAAAQHTCELQMLRALAGRTVAEDSFDDGQFQEGAFLARFGRLPYMEHTYAECRAMHGLILGDPGILVPHAAAGLAGVGDVAGYYMTVYAHVFAALAAAWQLQADPAHAHAPQWRERLASCSAWLAARAADQPLNYAHLLRLVQAEEAWAGGDRWSAILAFDAALADARGRDRPWHRAVITERAGLFHLSHGLPHSAAGLLAEARDLYGAWGAKAKVRKMEREHKLLPSRALAVAADIRSIRQASGSLSADAMDLMGVLRASQALSSETSLQRLAERVAEVLAALSGATRVLVLSRSADQWLLLAPTPGEPAIPIAQAAMRGLLPMTAFTYAERTGERLLLDDASADDRFARDPYLQARPDCSLLLVPVSSPDATRAMLVLENTQGRAAFNADRLDAVMLIAGQLAVSLANAQL